ncbi:unnamed protein product [Kluyveromyces dobzhanskii CBS 2104]|uniref:1,3-beta-glucanosyltransferase n=1 Tax=Kluyveromyces dobzhanskii CBS 2104 TaxID=1427455 RepID=A0A0A8L471_9SACH|nr:unnamed protein product [Kluyveromyces dobzhanskii CBS 2104]
MVLPSVLLGALISSTFVDALLPIHTKGDRFILPASPKNDPSDNTVFFVQGIDYQPGGSSSYDSDSDKDALTDESLCARDAFVFQQLGINTIRIYSLNPDLNHDKCMTILNNAGIYVILDVNSGEWGESLNRADPSGSYKDYYLNRVFKFVEAFKNYPNVIGFFSGNEVINDDSDYATIDPPYIRAVQRDMKQYIEKHSNRSIPVGYSAADNVDLRVATYDYLQCNSLNGSAVNEDLQTSRSDFYGLNTYEWCSGISDWTSSGYDKLESTFKNGSIPAIFSEFGCITAGERSFDEVSGGLYDGLLDTFSGGLVYEYSEEANNYGLVKIDDDGNIEYKADFANLKSQYEKISLPTIKESDVEDVQILTCNASKIAAENSKFGTGNFTIPDQPSEIAKLIENGVDVQNVGKILTDYDAPTTLNYTIKDADGKVVDATITYPASNTVNELSVSASATSSASSASSSSSTAGSSSTSQSSSKSSGDAVGTFPVNTGLLTIVAGVISALL